MITMVMYAKIRRMRLRDKLDISEIARRTSLSRNTIKKWLRESDSHKVKYQRESVDTVITPYAVWIDTALKTDSHRPKRDRRTAVKLFTEIKKQGFRQLQPCERIRSALAQPWWSSQQSRLCAPQIQLGRSLPV